ncbi:sensor histidine kinase [Tenacibaculum sp. M341]|uniref:sensor histidine kinase n=1 Tax=Tenacibaculum sp. M341 TaxID=2530339 RepID=UPI00104F8EBB|nr:two-component regulator propeller domain-containing protein [Tenacibaculum sp. M341]TCI85513.1 hypothetical protein EYW44_16250 [Tenacibaculum sp. M341]
MTPFDIKKHIITFVCCLLCWHSISQKILFKHYTTENGLPDDTTYQIIQDNNGFIWIGTDTGISKFNGQNFIQISDQELTSNYVIDIIETKKNNEFILATWGGGIHYLQKDSIYKPNIKNDQFTKVNQLYQINDSLVLGASNFMQYMYNLKSKTLKYYSLVYNDSINKVSLQENARTFFNKNLIISDVNLYKDKNNVYIFSSEINDPGIASFPGVYKLNSEKLKKVNIPALNDKIIQSFLKQGNTTIATSFNSLFLFHNGALTFEENLDLKEGKVIQTLLIDDKLYFVYSFKNDGHRTLFSYNFTDKQLLNLSEKLQIKSHVSDILIDNDHNIWVTTYGQGVFQILNNNNLFLDNSSFYNPDLRDIVEIDDNIFIVSTNIIYNLNPEGKISSIRTPYFTESLYTDAKNNLYSIMPSTGDQRRYKAEIGNTIIRNIGGKKFIFNYKNHTIDISGNKYRFIENDKVIYSDYFNKNMFRKAKSAILYKNKILASFDNQGIYELNLDSKKTKLWDKSVDLNVKNYSNILVKKDTFWIGSNNGIFKVTPEKTTHYTKEEGLTSNNINHLYFDKHGVLWIATQKGLNVLYNNHFYVIEKETGQKSTSVKKITELNNFIYVAGNKGLFKYDNTVKFSPTNNTTLLIKQKEETFNLETINFTNPKSIKIAYKLNSDPWVITSNNQLNFNNNKQGNYKIQFKYKDNLSDWKYSKTYTFSIRYPWHQQTSFYIIIITLSLGFLILLLGKGLKKSILNNKMLEKSIEEKEQLEKALKEVRKNVARDFHDELGNKLASISISSGLLIDDTYQIDDKKREKKIQQIKNDADYLYHGMKDFIWSLDHKNDDLQQLQVYLNDFGESLFENTKISFYSSHNLNENQIVLPYYWSKQLVLIFKEAMTNVLKHSKASKVELDFHFDKNEVIISLKDNGIGFSEKEINRINGINNMKDRAKSIEQQLTINSSEKGTLVTFEGYLNN